MKSSSKYASVQLLSIMGKLSEKISLKIVQKYIEERILLNAGQFGFCAWHYMVLQFLQLMVYMGARGGAVG